MADYTQESRILALDTPLGTDVLLLTAVSGEEGLSKPFRFILDMLSERDEIAPADIVGKNVTFSLRLKDGSHRHFNGFVSSFYAGAHERRGFRSYRAEVVPWLWFLTRTADCRIFQNKSIPEIIEQIFSDLGFSDFETSEIRGKHPPWEYCVQYRETDFNFVSRLMEQEGISYFFKHEDGRHVLCLFDQAQAHPSCAESNVQYFSGDLAEPHIGRWEHEYEFRPGKWAQTDYNFKNPSTSLLTSTNTVIKLPGVDKYEIYDYPGEYLEKSAGDPQTRIRMEEDELSHHLVHGQSDCRTFFAGGKFTLSRHDDAPGEKGKSYVLGRVRHAAFDESYVAGEERRQEYHNDFTGFPDSSTFRPPRVTPKPVIQGLQTAVVVGPKGEEIYTDEFGRIKVQFHWDREGKKNENSSCWIRVAQNWAGKKWGIIFNPRIGQEVVVAFLEGDPDRPLVIGRVYNADQMPPYDLPADQTKSTIKTRSSKSGSTENFNEIRFEDKKGSEEIYIHAEKDENVVVENDQSISVGHDRTEVVDNNKGIRVGVDHTENIGKNMTISVGSNLTESVGVNYSETVGAAMELTVGAELVLTVGAEQTISVGADQDQTVGGKRTLSVAKDLTERVDGKLEATVKKEYGLKAKKISIVADDEITLKTGSAQVILKKNGDITIKGKKINIKGSGDVAIKGSKVAQN